MIGDIITFDDDVYYFSILEDDTGLGAMELHVNPYTGAVYQQPGPSMMWNTKYAVQTSSGYGIMNGSGMMGRYAYNVTENNQERNTVSLSEAKGIAEEYLNSTNLEGYSFTGDGHEFYGYYTFHLRGEDSKAAIISVNGFTGAVWFHDWNGGLVDSICRYSD